MDLATMVLAARLLVPAQDAPLIEPVEPIGPVLMSRFERAPAPGAESAFELGTGPQPAFRYSKAYYKRLTIHRWGSYAILPLFAAQAIAGQAMYDVNSDADWAETYHPIGAALIGTLFTSNTVTGVMNLWEGRKDPQRGKRPVVHAILMLTADAGFVTTAVLGSRADETIGDRRTHRTVAISSMAIATAGYLTMLLRPD